MGRPRPRFTTLLASSAVGVYLLVVGGATAAIGDAVHACTTWPTCAAPTLSEPALLVAWGHRLTAILVGGLIVWTAVRAVRSDAPGVSGRVTLAVLAALALFPIQAGLGAFVATSGAAAPLPAAHLLTGMAIFGALLGALAWQLETETGDSRDGPTSLDATAPAGDSAPDATTSDVADGAEASAERRIGLDHALAVGRAYIELTKPRLMWLLCLVALAAMALAAGPDLADSVDTVLLTLGGGVLAIGASGTFNHVLERDVDQRMERTADRPVATHEVPVRNALAFGGLLAVASLALFAQVNWLTAALGLSAIAFYSVVYTLLLKPNTVQNTVIGGFAGSLPALIGWAAVTGTVGPVGLALAAVIFCWTPAHFYNLALAYKDDYARSGFPMMPVVRGDTATRKHIVGYLGATLVVAGLVAGMTTLGPLYALTTATLGAVFLWAVVRLHREQTEAAAFRAFHASNAYLGALLLAVVIDSLVL